MGKILDYIRQNGMEKNTIVIYTTDQGFYLGEKGWFDKRYMYEESLAMPLLVKYPGHITPGSRISALTQNLDFAEHSWIMPGLLYLRTCKENRYVLY